MITVKGRELIIPKSEQQIGTSYDNNAEVRHIRIDRVTSRGIDIASLNYRLDLEYANDVLDTCLLDVEVQEEYILLTWTIPDTCVAHPGTVWIAVRAYDNIGTIRWATNRGAVYVQRTVNTPGNVSDSQLSEMEQLEVRYESLHEEVKTSLKKTDESAQKANVSAENADVAAKSALDARNDILTRLKNGEFKGEKGEDGERGEKGESGLVVPTNGMFSLYLDEKTGDLYAEYQDGEKPPAFQYEQDTGNLYFVFDEEVQTTSGGMLPSGGTEGQILAKKSDSDYDVGWNDASADISFEVRNGNLIAKYGKES